MSSHYDVAAYIWPAFHDDPRSRIFWPEGMGEWETVRAAKPKFPGHRQPRVPLWGYQNEADPRVMEQHIDAATQFLKKAKERIDKSSLSAPLVTINSWNEWTEFSYLLPDTEFGMGYLDAVRRVFG